MSPLAHDIYAILRTRVRSGHPELTPRELVAKLPSPFSTLEDDSPILATALDELASACRARGLPAITAMVVATNAEDGPAPGLELTKVRSSSYPPAL